MAKSWFGVVTGALICVGLTLAGCEKQPAGPAKPAPSEGAKVTKPKPAVPPEEKKAAKPAEAPKPAPAAEKPAAQPAPPAPAPSVAEPAPIPPPAGAVVLFDGKDNSKWEGMGGKPCPWKVENGALACVPGSGSIVSKEEFGDCRLHIEFRVPLMPDAKGQSRGNSGVYLQGRYEIQVLDSFGIAQPDKGDCGALYSIVAPRVNACKPPEQWQTYDITFRAPKFDAQGKMVKKGELTVLQNGIDIIDKFPLDRNTPGELDKDLSKPGPILLQDHGNLVKYRDIWLVPLKAE
jgi:hypothetical protein